MTSSLVVYGFERPLNGVALVRTVNLNGGQVELKLAQADNQLIAVVLVPPVERKRRVVTAVGCCAGFDMLSTNYADRDRKVKIEFVDFVLDLRGQILAAADVFFLGSTGNDDELIEHFFLQMPGWQGT